MDVDLLPDPGGEVRHIAVDSGSQHFAEAHAAPGRQAEQCPAPAVRLLAHQRSAAVALSPQQRHEQTDKEKTPLGLFLVRNPETLEPENHGSALILSG